MLIFIYLWFILGLAYMEWLVNMLLLKGDANFRVSHQKYAIPAPLYGTHFNVDLKWRVRVSESRRLESETTSLSSKCVTLRGGGRSVVGETRTLPLCGTMEQAEEVQKRPCSAPELWLCSRAPPSHTNTHEHAQTHTVLELSAWSSTGVHIHTPLGYFSLIQWCRDDVFL